MFKMRFITFRTVFKQELFFLVWGLKKFFDIFLISWYRDLEYFLTIFFLVLGKDQLFYITITNLFTFYVVMPLR